MTNLIEIRAHDSANLLLSVLVEDISSIPDEFRKHISKAPFLAVGEPAET